MPRAGYVLVQLGTAEEERLRLCWNQPDRPERFFVPYTYVNACKIHGMLLKQIFVHEGQPIRMHIDSSIANINVRAALSARIMVSHTPSGHVCALRRAGQIPLNLLHLVLNGSNVHSILAATLQLQRNPPG